MATNDPLKEAASSPLTDVNRLNQLAYGSEGNDQLANINKSLEEQIKSLEERYAQPNWYKVAAGFAKPQLGGFMASLGSASEAMGENLEQQRAMGIPLAKMRTEMAVNSAILSKNKQVSDEIQAWYKDPKNAGKLPPDQLAADWRARAPDAPAVKSLDTQIGLQQKAREQAIKNVEAARALEKQPSQADLDLLNISNKPTNNLIEPNKTPTSTIPLHPNDVKPGEKVDFGFAQIPEKNLMTPAGLEQVKAENSTAKERLDAIAKFGAPENFHNYNQHIDQLLTFVGGKGPEFDKRRAILDKVTNVMSSDSALLSALMAASNEGIHANWNGLTASAGAPVRTFMSNFTDKEERRVAQMLVMALDNANHLQTQIKGGLKGGLPVSEANVLTAGLLSRDLNYQTLMNGLLQLDNTLNMYHNLHDGARVLKNKYSDQLTSQAPYYQIYNSDWYNNVVNHYSILGKQISQKYNQSIVQ
jgi:hypothetical protein